MGSSILGWSAAPPRWRHEGRRLDQGLRPDVLGHKIGVLPQAVAGPLDLHHHRVMEQTIQKSRRDHGILDALMMPPLWIVWYVAREPEAR
jgi:hypothetical protein